MYSQNNEEQIILDYFKDFKGTFLDIGANDGITLSNTRKLAEDGWKGIMVEPSIEAFRILKDNVKKFDDVYAYMFALMDYNGEVKLYESGNIFKTDTGLVSTVIEEEKSRWANTTFKEITVKCFRWKTFKNRIKFKTFDFINIDCEGMDFKILKQINLEATKLLCIEWNGKEKIKSQVVQYCSNFGLDKLLLQNAENLILAR